MEMEYRSSDERIERVQRNVHNGTPPADAAAMRQGGSPWVAGPLHLNRTSLWTFGHSASGTAAVYRWSRRRVGAEWALRSFGVAVGPEPAVVPAVVQAGAAVLPMPNARSKASPAGHCSHGAPG